MADDTSNDNEPVATFDQSAPDPHGQAALLLVESLIHGLIARSVLSVAEAVEIVDVAAEVEAEIAHDLGHTPSEVRKSLVLLKAISASLRPNIQA